MPQHYDPQVIETIIRIGKERGKTRREIVSALSAGMVESNLQNVSEGDRDSVGVFQQRPSQGWGTPEQLTDVEYAVNAYYDATEQFDEEGIHGAELAARVQRPAEEYRHRYAQRWDDAQELFDKHASGEDVTQVSQNRDHDDAAAQDTEVQAQSESVETLDKEGSGPEVQGEDDGGLALDGAHMWRNVLQAASNKMAGRDPSTGIADTVSPQKIGERASDDPYDAQADLQRQHHQQTVVPGQPDPIGHDPRKQPGHPAGSTGTGHPTGSSDASGDSGTEQRGHPAGSTGGGHPTGSSRASGDRMTRAEAEQAADAARNSGHSWGGHQNGKIPQRELKQVEGHIRLEDNAADAWKQMKAAAAADGVNLSLTDGYRTLESQQSLRREKPDLAATPGTSIHGWGRAADVKKGGREWIQKNGYKFGWIWPEWAQDPSGQYEPWHFEFVGPKG